MGNVISLLRRWFGGTPDEYNSTNAGFEYYYEKAKQEEKEKEKAEADAADAKKRAEEAEQLEEEAKKREEDARKRAEKAEHVAQQAQREADEAKKKGEESEKREKEAKKKQEEARRLYEKYKQAMLDAQKLAAEYHARMLETQKRAAEARKAANDARKAKGKLQKDLQQVKFHLEKGIQPDTWPTEEEFQFAKKKIQYDPENFHFAVWGSSGSGKSSLVNAFRGLKNNSPHAARTGVTEAVEDITRYPDPRQNLPYKRLVWFDCPGGGTLKAPSENWV